MFHKKNKLIFVFTVLVVLISTSAQAERRLMSNIAGNWKLKKVKVSGQSIAFEDSGYLTISRNKEVSYQGLCKTYVGNIATSNRKRKRFKRRGRAFKFKAGFKFNKIASDEIGCLGMDEFEANSNEILRARLLKRAGGTLKLRTGSTVFTFRKI